MAWKALKTGLALIPALFVFVFVMGVSVALGADPNLALFVGALTGSGTLLVIERNVGK